MIDRREMMKRAGIAALATGFSSSKVLALQTVTLPIGNGERPLVKYPQKRPMIGVTSARRNSRRRFRSLTRAPITPTMRSSSAIIWRRYSARYRSRQIHAGDKGQGRSSAQTFAEGNQKMPAVELVAVNQCSGNSRGFSIRASPAARSGNGAMGNARWRGVPLKAVLDKAGVQARRKAGHLERNGRTGERQDAGFRQGA